MQGFCLSLLLLTTAIYSFLQTFWISLCWKNAFLYVSRINIIIAMSVSVCVCVCVRHIIMNDSNCSDKVLDVGSWWNFQICLWMMIPIIWYHLQVHQEPPCPPTLQEETWRTGGILTRFLMLDLDETFTEASERWSLISDTNSMFIRNLHDLHDSKKRLGGQEESWQGSWCWILMKLSQKLLKDDL